MRALLLGLLIAATAVGCVGAIQKSEMSGNYTVIDGPSISITLEQNGNYREQNVREDLEIVVIDSGSWLFDGRILLLKSDRPRREVRRFVTTREVDGILISSDRNARYKKSSQPSQGQRP